MAINPKIALNQFRSYPFYCPYLSRSPRLLPAPFSGNGPSPIRAIRMECNLQIFVAIRAAICFEITGSTDTEFTSCAFYVYYVMVESGKIYPSITLHLFV